MEILLIGTGQLTEALIDRFNKNGEESICSPVKENRCPLSSTFLRHTIFPMTTIA